MDGYADIKWLCDTVYRGTNDLKDGNITILALYNNDVDTINDLC